MRVIVHPADKGGCGYYRLIWPAKALKTQGHDVRLDYNAIYRRVQWRDNHLGQARVVGLAQSVDADVIVLQRPLQRNRVEFIDALQAKGVAVVVEVDDDFHAIHPRNPAWVGSNPLHDRDRNRDWLMKACRKADLVTVTTPALAERYGAHGRVQILPNYVPARYLHAASGEYARTHLERPPGLLVGWSGSVATHPDDLQQTGGVMEAVLEATGAQFHVVGTGEKVAERLGLHNRPTSTGWVPIEAYPEALAQLDVGIVPLAPTVFNEAKSWLKGLEFAAASVPFVASPTGPYRELCAAGIGWLDHWDANLRRLLTDHVMREELSVAWQDRIRERFTVEHNAWRWAEAWAQAVANRKAGVAA